VTLVGAGPGDPDLLTVAARDILAEADHVFHDALVGPEILSLCGPDTALVNVGKRGGRPSTAQSEIITRMIEQARAGRDVVRLKGGDPFVFGRGGEEMSALVSAGIEVIVIPGISAALAAPAAADIPLTMRGVASSVGIISGHLEKTGEVPGDLESLAGAVDTLVVLMPLNNLGNLIGRLLPILGPNRPCALIASATTDHQRIFKSTLAGLADHGLEGPATLVVGNVVNPTAAE
jgi:uroporphyrin-III C-methyltransferase